LQDVNVSRPYGYGLNVTQRNLTDAIRVAAQKQKFHPIRDFLEAAEWDGKKRLDTMFIDYLGCEDNAFTRAASAMTLLAAVARVFEPGHKFDFCTVLESPQGHRKSTFIVALANGWFGELSGNVHKRQEMVESMQGVWIMEIAAFHVGVGAARSSLRRMLILVDLRNDGVAVAQRHQNNRPQSTLFQAKDRVHGIGIKAFHRRAVDLLLGGGDQCNSKAWLSVYRQCSEVCGA
jgi:hypothetical protein